MSYASPYGTPLRGGEPGYYYDVQSPSPTPSPRHYPFYPAQTPQRPATRAHVRNASTDYPNFRPSTAFSPRYKSNGEYATGPSPNVSSRKHSFSMGSHHHMPRRERRSSFSYHRASHGDSDEDEVFEIGGVRCVLFAESKSRKRAESFFAAPGHGTDHYYRSQGMPTSFYEKERTEYPQFDEPPARSATRRPATTRPSSSHKKKPAASGPKKATEADAKKHRIPAGYSLKNWDPTEEPIMLLGSVFDSNSLGKWIYDWTVHYHGAATPIADVAGELWVLLIQLSGKVKRAEEVVPEVRTQANKEMIEDFIESGERLTDRLRVLLKKCEAPMLRSAKSKEASHLGQNAGVEFVKTIFGRERELERTEAFMQQVRLWNLRFDANCEDILKRPKQ
ncbi:uncharacterized protein F4807DRAFT_452402 [Annulohypoxylon truncatum]|uniref:uncharacterized protein n=1 Tax=Annulohypoxylon truncatum TaxID=327061 RepID=UPI0020077744|nr:uncharacterized protein F4807DRAFT_452402 [Annulohypoxylon truncatum]KAI1208126.1 hypothetical protein F4807DRAFT_452402 [Annulohypoxylon truncatum]